jgi:acyl carrier protein
VESVRGRRQRSHARSTGDPSLEEQVDSAIAASFNLDEDELPVPASRETISSWTSRSQMLLLMNLENRFDVCFTLEQMVGMTSAQRIVEVLRPMLG